MLEEGYDSDGELGPFLDAVVDQGGVDVEGEDDGLPDSMVVVGSGSGNTTNTNGEVTSPDWFLSDEQINVLKVDALKEAKKMRGIVPKGRKDELRVMLKKRYGEGCCLGGLSSTGFMSTCRCIRLRSKGCPFLVYMCSKDSLD
mmetsp:Transcript_27858/g.55792  ORF Transcript_27858/g.55792 Transcript_27858/m.55792 type:complete len:143 (+) Transcript_27858:492-920(+)